MTDESPEAAPPVARVRAAPGWPARVRRAVSLELGPLARLGGPVVLAEIGWMVMGIVDTIMVGPLGPAALGGVGVASSVFFGVAVFGMGTLLGLDTVVSQSVGAGDLVRCRRWLWQGLWLGLAVSLPLAAILLVIAANISRLGPHPDVAPIIETNLRILGLSLGPLLLYAAVRRYLQALGLVRPLMFALVSANIVNAAGNWVLIHGHAGLPALGTDGAAWATVLARGYMACVLVIAALDYDRRHARAMPLWRVAKRPAWRELRLLTRLGLPAAAQLTLEIGVFASASALASKLPPVSLAAHQIALNIAGLTYMIPLGVSSAAAVRVGRAIGAGHPDGARRAGWVSLASVGVMMLATALIFVLIPRTLIGFFTRDPGVLTVGASLLAVGAMFQLFDGLQVTATGALRGAGETRTPMWWNFVGHWVIGLPLGWTLCFRAGWGVIGLWLGLCAGLVIVGAMLLWAWRRRERSLPDDVR